MQRLALTHNDVGSRTTLNGSTSSYAPPMGTGLGTVQREVLRAFDAAGLPLRDRGVWFDLRALGLLNGVETPARSEAVRRAVRSLVVPGHIEEAFVLAAAGGPDIGRRWLKVIRPRLLELERFDLDDHLEEIAGSRLQLVLHDHVTRDATFILQAARDCQRCYRAVGLLEGHLAAVRGPGMYLPDDENLSGAPRLPVGGFYGEFQNRWRSVLIQRTSGYGVTSWKR